MIVYRSGDLFVLGWARVRLKTFDVLIKVVVFILLVFRYILNVVVCIRFMFCLIYASVTLLCVLICVVNLKLLNVVCCDYMWKVEAFQCEIHEATISPCILIYSALLTCQHILTCGSICYWSTIGFISIWI